MRLSTIAFAGTLCALTSTSLIGASNEQSTSFRQINKRMRPIKSSHVSFSKRDPPTNDYQQSIVGMSSSNPIQAAIMAQDIDGVKNNVDGGDLANGNTLIPGDSWSAQNPQDNQYNENKNVYFYPNAEATPGNSEADGWVALPQLGGFDLRRDVIRDNAKMPYYITSNYDPSAIKKAVIIFPGKNRDSWKYTNLVRNAFEVALVNHPELGLTNGTVLTLGPAVLNDYDVQFGAALADDITWHGTQWQGGEGSRTPTLDHKISLYEVLDHFTDWLFNTTNFPNLNAVTIAGHSMGGQAVQRYAILKKQKVYDDNIHYWVGNPGSYAWLEDERPVQNASCTEHDTWKYGVGGNMTKVPRYARKDVEANKTEVVSRYFQRKVHYGLALLDNGPGDTHCEAVMQGGNHLDRGSNFVQLLGKMANGFPSSTQTVDFVANVSHQDYAMLSNNQTLAHLFKDGYDQRLPDITASNPGDKAKNTPNAHPPPRKFATQSNKLLSYALLGGSVGLIIVVFTLLPFLFPANSDPWEQERWEQDAKRQLL